MAYRVAVVGASGYGGAELLRLLDAHPAIEVAVVAAHTHAGEDVSALFPNLPAERALAEVDVGQLVGQDLVFLATPHGPSLRLGAALHDGGTRTVDLSGAFRLSADDFATWYGQAHPRPDLTPLPRASQPTPAPGTPDGSGRGPGNGVVYGLTEWARSEVVRATLVANPGCYPTAALLGLLPLAALVDPTTIVIDAKSGTSGAGRAATDALHFAHVAGSLTAYGAPSHRHTGEIEAWLAALGGVARAPLSFTPHLVPMPRGELITAYATLRPGVSDDDVQSALADRYAGEPFVRILPAGTFPVTKAVAGSNGCQLSAVVDRRTRRVVVTVAIDNLGKGAAGQALQNANLMLGLDESLGLTAVGVYP